MSDSARRDSTAPSSWNVGGDPAAVLAGARRALFVMTGVLALLWLIQILNWADNYGLTARYGIRGQDVASLPDIFTAPFLHFSWAHIEGNSGPLFIFGFLAAYRGVTKWIWVTVLVVVVSGLAAWLTEGSHALGAGASGVVFGYLGYIMVRGFFDRHPIDMLVGAVMALCFAYQFTVLLPRAGIGWQAHIGGLAGGILAGWIFRDRRASRSVAPPSPATAISGPARPGTTAISPAPGPSAGPRADLHKRLDDLGL
ncbi:MAG: rhomboid family intramembrane serine protease [Streptosporangiaceae bacterium]